MQLVRVVNSLSVNPIKLSKIFRFNLLLQRIKDFPGVIVQHGPVFRPSGSPFAIEAPQAPQLIRGQSPIPSLRSVV